MLKTEAKGNNKVISTSKIKKITAIRKNRKEKGSRADPLGSNPHSYGEFFSRSEIVFLEIKEANTMIKWQIKIVIKENNSNVRIIFSRS